MSEEHNEFLLNDIKPDYMYHVWVGFTFNQTAEKSKMHHRNLTQLLQNHNHFVKR